MVNKLQMPNKPLVSVIIPTFNREDWLRKCLNALQCQKLSRQKYEVIVCDDGSTDKTNELVKTFPMVRYIQLTHSGSPGKVRNTGAKKALGKILAFTDDDCIPSKNWLNNALKYFKDQEVIGVEGLTKISMERTSPLTILTYTYHGAGFMTCNIFYRKSVFEAVKGFDPSYQYFREDTDLAWRILDSFPDKKIIFASNAIVEHQVIKYTLKKFLVKHFRTKETYLNFKLCRNHPTRFRKSPEMIFGLFSTHTIWHYLLTVPLIMITLSILNKSSIGIVSSAFLFLQTYAIVTFLHTRMKSNINIKHLIQYKGEFLKLLAVWWIVILYDWFWKFIGTLRHLTVIL